MSPDKFNSLVLLLCSVFVWLNVYKAFQHDQIRGAHLIPALLFAGGAIWGVWYLYYLHQYYSMACEVSLATANTAYVVMFIYYIPRDRKAS